MAQPEDIVNKFLEIDVDDPGVSLRHHAFKIRATAVINYATPEHRRALSTAVPENLVYEVDIGPYLEKQHPSWLVSWFRMGMDEIARGEDERRQLLIYFSPPTMRENSAKYRQLLHDVFKVPEDHLALMAEHHAPLYLWVDPEPVARYIKITQPPEAVDGLDAVVAQLLGEAQEDVPDYLLNWAGDKHSHGALSRQQFGIVVHVTDEDTLREQAKERQIELDTDKLTDSIRWLESNLFDLLRGEGLYVQEEGHDGDGAAVASAWIFSTLPPEAQVYTAKKVLEIAEGEPPSTSSGTLWKTLPESTTKLYRKVDPQYAELLDVSYEFIGLEGLRRWMQLNLVEDQAPDADDPQHFLQHYAPRIKCTLYIDYCSQVTNIPASVYKNVDASGLFRYSRARELVALYRNAPQDKGILRYRLLNPHQCSLTRSWLEGIGVSASDILGMSELSRHGMGWLLIPKSELRTYIRQVYPDAIRAHESDENAEIDHPDNLLKYDTLTVLLQNGYQRAPHTVNEVYKAFPVGTADSVFVVFMRYVADHSMYYMMFLGGTSLKTAQPGGLGIALHATTVNILINRIELFLSKYRNDDNAMEAARAASAAFKAIVFQIIRDREARSSITEAQEDSPDLPADYLKKAVDDIAVFTTAGALPTEQSHQLYRRYIQGNAPVHYTVYVRVQEPLYLGILSTDVYGGYTYYNQNAYFNYRDRQEQHRLFLKIHRLLSRYEAAKIPSTDTKDINTELSKLLRQAERRRLLKLNGQLKEAVDPEADETLQNYVSQQHDLHDLRHALQDYGLYAHTATYHGKWAVLHGYAYWAVDQAGVTLPVEFFQKQLEDFAKKHRLVRYYQQVQAEGEGNQQGTYFKLAIPKYQLTPDTGTLPAGRPEPEDDPGLPYWIKEDGDLSAEDALDAKQTALRLVDRPPMQYADVQDWNPYKHHDYDIYYATFIIPVFTIRGRLSQTHSYVGWVRMPEYTYANPPTKAQEFAAILKYAPDQLPGFYPSKLVKAHYRIGQIYSRNHSEFLSHSAMTEAQEATDPQDAADDAADLKDLLHKYTDLICFKCGNDLTQRHTVVRFVTSHGNQAELSGHYDGTFGVFARDEKPTARFIGLASLASGRIRSELDTCQRCGSRVMRGHLTENETPEDSPDSPAHVLSQATTAFDYPALLTRLGFEYEGTLSNGIVRWLWRNNCVLIRVSIVDGAVVPVDSIVSVYQRKRIDGPEALWTGIGSEKVSHFKLETFLKKHIAHAEKLQTSGQDNVIDEARRASDKLPEPASLAAADDPQQELVRHVDHNIAQHEAAIDAAIDQACAEFEVEVIRRNIARIERADELAAELGAKWAEVSGYANGTDEFDVIVSAVSNHVGTLFPLPEEEPESMFEDRPPAPEDILGVLLDQQIITPRAAERYRASHTPESDQRLNELFIQLDELLADNPDETPPEVEEVLRQMANCVVVTNARYGTNARAFLNRHVQEDQDVDDPQGVMHRTLANYQQILRAAGFTQEDRQYFELRLPQNLFLRAVPKSYNLDDYLKDEWNPSIPTACASLDENGRDCCSSCTAKPCRSCRHYITLLNQYRDLVNRPKSELSRRPIRRINLILHKDHPYNEVTLSVLVLNSFLIRLRQWLQANKAQENKGTYANALARALSDMALRSEQPVYENEADDPQVFLQQFPFGFDALLKDAGFRKTIVHESYAIDFTKALVLEAYVIAYGWVDYLEEHAPGEHLECLDLVADQDCVERGVPQCAACARYEQLLNSYHRQTALRLPLEARRIQFIFRYSGEDVIPGDSLILNRKSLTGFLLRFKRWKASLPAPKPDDTEKYERSVVAAVYALARGTGSVYESQTDADLVPQDFIRASFDLPTLLQRMGYERAGDSWFKTFPGGWNKLANADVMVEVRTVGSPGEHDGTVLYTINFFMGGREMYPFEHPDLPQSDARFNNVNLPAELRRVEKVILSWDGKPVMESEPSGAAEPDNPQELLKRHMEPESVMQAELVRLGFKVMRDTEQATFYHIAVPRYWNVPIIASDGNRHGLAVMLFNMGALRFYLWDRTENHWKNVGWDVNTSSEAHAARAVRDMYASVAQSAKESLPLSQEFAAAQAVAEHHNQWHYDLLADLCRQNT